MRRIVARLFTTVDGVVEAPESAPCGTYRTDSRAMAGARAWSERVEATIEPVEAQR